MDVIHYLNTTTKVTRSDYQNIYELSPTALVVPYACCFATVLPLILLGFHSLRLNGEAAPRGFVQMLATTTGSDALRIVAAAARMDGNRYVSQKLKDMKIMYGELRVVGGQRGGKRRLGFELRMRSLNL